MIVTCGQCKTRFKIPDEKVAPEKGVKVRCTKCGHTFRVTREASPAGPPPPVPPERDPFASFGSSADVAASEPARPGPYALGAEPGRGSGVHPQPAGATPAAFDFAHLPGAPPPAPAGPPAPAPFDFGALSVPPPASALGGGAFDFAALSASQPPPATQATPSFDFSALSAPPPPPPPPSGPRPGHEVPAVAATASLDFSSFAPAPAPGFLEGPPSLGGSPAGRSGALPAARRSPSRAVTQPLAAAEPPARSPPSAPGVDGFFGAPAPAPARQPLLDLPEDASQESARDALFDMPLELPAPPLAPSVPELPGAAAQATFPSGVRPQAGPAPAAPAPPRHRTALGVVVNLVIAAALVVGVLVVGSALLNEGKLSRESLSLDALKASFVSSSDFVASDISNGLYATRAGRSVFFVRGEVQNRSPGPARVVVRAEILEGSVVVRTARTVAGVVPTPEELFNLAEGQSQDDLSAKLAGRAVVVAPGAAAEFLLTFTEYPPDLKAFRVRVSAQAEGRGTSASLTR